MNHDVVLEGYGCRLRPVRPEDAAFIVGLRCQPFAQIGIHATSPSVAAQEAWIDRYLRRAGDYYWIIEAPRLGAWDPVGTIGLYDVTEDSSEAMPGRWVVYPQQDFPAALPVYLVYRFAFETLNMHRLVFDVVSANRKVLKFHNLMGARMIAKPPLRYTETEAEVGAPLTWFEITSAMWPDIKLVWEPIFAAYRQVEML